MPAQGLQVTSKLKVREAWLVRLAKLMERQFVRVGHPLPRGYRVSIGFTSKGTRGKRIGECWSEHASEGAVHEIFIVPTLEDERHVAETLCHELVHAAVGLEAKHGIKFRRCAKALGLTGKMTATYGGEDFWKWAEPLLARVGKFPHFRFTTGISSTGPRGKNFLLKCHCPDCGYIVRTTQKWIDIAIPVCPHPDCTERGRAMLVQEAV